MKILKVRRGFTTNSSASSEWIPAQTSAQTGAPPPSTPPTAEGNALRIGGLLGVVAVAFAMQRLVRSRFKRDKSGVTK